jgi:hypothetical protein
MASILLSIWVQLGSLFFLLAGVHGDLLLIRLYLFLAYTMLLVNAVMGSPLWPNLTNLGDISFLDGLATDSLVWAILSLYVHGWSFVALMRDEREVLLKEDEAALWYMMYRTGGLSARLFQDMVAPYLNVVEVQEGQTVDTDEYFWIIYKGKVQMEVLDELPDELPKYSKVLLSGEMFDLKHLGGVSKHAYFENAIRCTALSTTTLFQIRKDDLGKISQNPRSKNVFLALLINNFMDVVESHREVNRPPQQANSRHFNKIFEPLEDWEKPKSHLSGSGRALRRPFLHLWNGSKGSFSLPWPFSSHPIGLRQTHLPPPPQREEDQIIPINYRRSKYGSNSNSRIV